MAQPVVWSRRLDPAVWLPPLLLLGWALWCLWPNLDHPAMFGWDEPAHQLATRGFHASGLPLIYGAPLVPRPKTAWWNAHVFLHKPPLPFAMGALLMWIVGITPLALRLVSLASAFVTALGLYFFGRRVVGSLLAATLASAFLCLPFTYLLVQGYQFGDVTDCSLLAFVTLSMWVLAVALEQESERDSERLVAAAGALCGCAYLCKSVLALMPLGAIGALASLGAVSLAPRLRLRLVLVFAAAAVAVALPWNLYSALRWPELYRWEAHHTLGFLTDTTRYWVRPIDGVFTEVNQLEFAPWPVAIFPVAGLWLLWAALTRRSATLWLLCLWLWGEWIPLSLALVKVPAHAWAAAPAALLAVGLLIHDSFERPWLAGAGLGALGAGVALRAGLGSALVVAAIGFGVALLSPKGRRAFRRLGWVTAAAAICVGLLGSSVALRLMRLRFGAQAVDAYGDELGRTLARTLPANAVLFVSTRDPPYSLSTHSLMFYSGLTAYPANEDLIQLARLEGRHPYLVSSIAQPFQRVEAAPASAWLQAFDLDAPQVSPMELPRDVTLADRQLGALALLGLSVAHGDSDRDRYVFYVRSTADMEMRLIGVSFTLTDGSVVDAKLTVQRELEQPLIAVANGPGAAGEEAMSAASLSATPIEWISDPKAGNWYTLAIAGPPRSRLRGLTLLGADLPLP